MTTKAFDISGLVKALKKNFSDVVCRVGDPVSPLSLAPGRISTGALNVDLAIGGGIPTGRITEIFSRKESQGKSTLVLSIIRAAQQAGVLCLYLDTEQVSVGPRFTAIGVNADSLIYGQPESIEQTFEITEQFIQLAAEEGKTALVVVDSIAAMNTMSQINAEYDSAQGKRVEPIADLARAMSSGLRRINRVVTAFNATLIFTNQVRSKIGVVYGENLTTPGGFALRFYASLRLELRQMEKLYTTNKREVGITVRATVKKSKVGSPFQVADFDILFASGVDPVSAAFRFALQRKLIEKSGNGYIGFDLKKSFLRTKFGDVLQENPTVWVALKEELIKALEEPVITAAIPLDEEAKAKVEEE